MLRNTDKEFGLVSKLLHWGMALHIFAMLIFGTYIANMKVGFDNLHLFDWHKASGLIALVLVLARLGWRYYSPVPGTLTRGTKPAELLLAHAVHLVLYNVMILMPLTGWIASSAVGLDITFFGLFRIPFIAPASEATEHLFFTIHGILAYVLIVAVIIHIAGALKRHFVLKDNTLRRMWF